MNPNPVTDVAGFLTQPGWMTGAFWFLLIASLVIANYAVITIPWQRRFSHVAQWTVRLLVGAMWWQQSLWRLPPYYTDHPEQPFGEPELAYWMMLMGKHAAIPLQADFVNQIVLPHFYLFAPVVYAAEVLTGVSLMLGTFVRFFALIGALQILNLWLGLYSAPGEWPWTYFFLLLLQLGCSVERDRRSLGIDAILAARPPARREAGWRRRLLDAI